jgi:hypothetical protein
MKISHIDNISPDHLNSGLNNFLNSLKNDTNKYHFRPCIHGLTEAGKRLQLGFSCYAVKTFYTINTWKEFLPQEVKDWENFINSFQKNKTEFPDNSYVDDILVEYFNKFQLSSFSKNIIKKSLNLSNRFNYQLKKDELHSSIRAESKQAIATLYQVNGRNKLSYEEFPQNQVEMENFLDSFDWSKPWSAGAQFSGLCVFSNTQLNQPTITNNNLEKYIDSKVRSDGFYYTGSNPNFTQLVNGTMKVLTGLDWLDSQIHYPEKLIDMCLANTPGSEGCDLVDYVYVLYRCSLQTKHKRKEIVDYLEKLYELIFEHFHFEIGGFSYGVKQSQKLYYGVTISKGYDEPDIHGTILLTWALSMIFKLTENDKYEWNILKP